jgi:hypothetical protein
MNSKSVLSKILTLLSLEDEKLIQAKTDDGTILQSSNFDVNDDVEVVNEDGTTSPAPDGEYTISFTTPEGAESTQVIDIDGGKVASISSPDEAEQVKEGTDEEKSEDMSDAGTLDNPTKGDSQNRIDVNSVPGAKMDDTKQSDIKMATNVVSGPQTKDATKEHAKGMPNTTDEDKANEVADPNDNPDVISLSYRISELEKMVKTMMDAVNPPSEEANDNIAPSANTPEGVNPATQMAEVDEDELPKLDGAPIEPLFKMNAHTVQTPNTMKKVGDSQSAFLSKLYS